MPRVVVIVERHDLLREIGLRQLFDLGRALQHVPGLKGRAHQVPHPLRRARDLLEDQLCGR
jgi:hypothetical protein